MADSIMETDTTGTELPVKPVVLPELKQIIGALVFGAKKPLTVAELRKIVVQTATLYEQEYSVFSAVKDEDVAEALARLNADLHERKCGFYLSETVAGWRLQSESDCGPWLRHMLDLGKPNRLSRPALETLAIVAYRQPVPRSEIESVRGVSVDAMVRLLMEMQLVRIVGRSDLPGRPLLYGTTQTFLERFGLQSLGDLPGIDQLKRRMAEQQAVAKARADAQPAEAQEPEAGAEPAEPGRGGRRRKSRAPAPEPAASDDSQLKLALDPESAGVAGEPAEPAAEPDRLDPADAEPAHSEPAPAAGDVSAEQTEETPTHEDGPETAENGH